MDRLEVMTFLNAFSKSFGSSLVPCARAASRRRFARSASDNLLDGDLRGMEALIAWSAI